MRKSIAVDIDLLKKLYLEDNLSLSELAKYFNIGVGIVERRLKCNNIKKSSEAIKQRYKITGLKSRHQLFQEDLEEELINLYITQNLNRDQVAKHYDISLPTLDKLLAKYNIIKDGDIVRAKAVETMLDRPEEAKIKSTEKHKQSCLVKFGVDNASKSVIVKAKISKVNKSLSKQADKKRRETNKSICGHEFFLQSPEYLDKLKVTCQEVYQADSVMASDYFKKASRDSKLQKYNTTNLMELPEMRLKISNSNKAHYGGKHNFQQHISSEVLKIVESRESLEKYIIDNGIEYLGDLSNALSLNKSGVARKINSFGLMNYMKPCISKYEKELKELYPNLVKTRKIIPPYEIDLYSENNSFGIEFNGDYWHSDLNVPHNYHQKKSLLAEQKGIKLIHVYENEWNNPIKKEIVKSIINSNLGIAEKIFARKCEVRVISNKESRPFLDQYSLHGHRNATISYGLYYQDQLVQLMSFGYAYYARGKYQYEVIRACTKNNTVVVGGQSRLFKRFLEDYKPKCVLYYVEYDKYNGNSLKNLGFEFERYSTPGFFYTDGLCMIHRNPSKNKTMDDIKNNMFKIYTAGVKVYTYKDINE